jgi:hypothetical protein
MAYRDSTTRVSAAMELSSGVGRQHIKDKDKDKRRDDEEAPM